MAEESQPKTTPIYVSYLTFTNLLDWLRDLGTLPSQFDRSFWGHKFSGSGGGQLMAGLRFLGLLKGDEPTERLEQIALASDDERRQLLIDLLNDAYGHDFIASLPRTTPKLVNDRLSDLGTTDTTHAKARSFFVNAAKAVGLSMPPQVAKQARNRPTVSRKTPNRKRTSDTTIETKTLEKPDLKKHDDVEGLPPGLHQALIPLLRDLAKDGPAWDERGRNRWKRTWDQTLVYAYPTVEEEDEEGETGGQ